jgi:hypothetical protein
MSSSRNINFGTGGTYNESINVKGDFVQGNKIVHHNFTQEIIDIGYVLDKFQESYPPDEAIQKTAHELAVKSKDNPEEKNKLYEISNYIATNGGIEAGIGKAIELALKLIIGI